MSYELALEEQAKEEEEEEREKRGKEKASKQACYFTAASRLFIQASSFPDHQHDSPLFYSFPSMDSRHARSAEKTFSKGAPFMTSHVPQSYF